MKRFIQITIVFVAFSVLAGSAHAQSVNLAFTPSSSGGSQTKVWRAPCPAVTGTPAGNQSIVGTCANPGTFAVIGVTPVGAIEYIDNSVNYSTGYAYRLTAICPVAGCTNGAAGESDPSPVLSAQTVPAPLPPKPSSPANFTITVP